MNRLFWQNMIPIRYNPWEKDEDEFPEPAVTANQNTNILRYAKVFSAYKFVCE